MRVIRSTKKTRVRKRHLQFGSRRAIVERTLMASKTKRAWTAATERSQNEARPLASGHRNLSLSNSFALGAVHKTTNTTGWQLFDQRFWQRKFCIARLQRHRPNSGEAGSDD